MSKKHSPLDAQKQAVAEFQAACALLKEVKKLMPRSNPALNPYIKALVAGFENFLADPHTPISKEPPRIKLSADGSRTVERGETRLTPHGFIWMAQIWLKSTNEWIVEQNRRKRREKKAKERLQMLRQAKDNLSPDLYTVAHAYHNYVVGKAATSNPRSPVEIVLNTDEFLAETEKMNFEVSHIEWQQKRQTVARAPELAKAA